MCTCFGVRDAQGWAWGLEEAPGHLWVVLVGISTAIKSLMNIWGISSQVWAVDLLTDVVFGVVMSSSLREQFSSHLARAVFGLLKPPQQALPAQNLCSCAPVWLQSQPSSGVQGFRQDLLSWSPPFSLLWKWILEQENPWARSHLLPGPEQGT